MPEEPYFPAPGAKRDRAASNEPYRSASDPPAADTPAPIRAVPPSSPFKNVLERDERTALVEAIVAAHARRRRRAMLGIVVGIALVAGGLLVTFRSRGHVIWYGAVFAGALAIVRGVLTLLGFRPDPG